MSELEKKITQTSHISCTLLYVLFQKTFLINSKSEIFPLSALQHLKGNLQNYILLNKTH